MRVTDRRTDGQTELRRAVKMSVFNKTNDVLIVDTFKNVIGAIGPVCVLCVYLPVWRTGNALVSMNEVNLR